MELICQVLDYTSERVVRNVNVLHRCDLICSCKSIKHKSKQTILQREGKYPFSHIFGISNDKQKQWQSPLYSICKGTLQNERRWKKQSLFWCSSIHAIALCECVWEDAQKQPGSFWTKRSIHGNDPLFPCLFSQTLFFQFQIILHKSGG